MKVLQHSLVFVITFFMIQNLCFAQEVNDSIVSKKKLKVKGSVIHKKIVQKKRKLLKPAYLKVGDTIAIVAPAGILKNKKEIVKKAKELAENWGLHVVYGKNMFNQENHFAGTDTERAADFQQALDNLSIKAIWAARGGYGSVRILDKLDFTKFLKQPKWIIGYSDITAIHSHIHSLGVETIHGMMASSLGDPLDEIEETVSTFKKTLFGEQLAYKIAPNKMNRIGLAKGEIIGGNLSILMSMLGSKSQINTTGKILFIEEIGEYKYSIDRMLQSLKRAGFFKKCKGLIIGDISNIKNNTTKWGKPIEQLILDVVSEYSFPVLFNFPAGHEKDNRALILGRTILVNVSNKNTSIVNFNN